MNIDYENEMGRRLVRQLLSSIDNAEKEKKRMKHHEWWWTNQQDILTQARLLQNFMENTSIKLFVGIGPIDSWRDRVV